MKFLDQAKIYIRSGDGGNGCRQLPAREIRRVRRPRRRQWRPWRRRLGRVRRGPQHPDRLPLPAAFQGGTGHQRHGQGPLRSRRRGCPTEAARRHPGVRGRQGNPDRRPDRGRPARQARARRQWRLRQRPFQILHQPRAAPRQSGRGGRRTLDLAQPQTDRRCRHHRPAQCRQVDLPVGRQRRQAEDRRLSVHHPGAEPRRGRRRRPRIRARRHSRPHRRRP